MDLQVRGKTFLVTASSKGLGKAIALELSKEGANIAICSRDVQVLARTAEDIRVETGQHVLAIEADVSNAQDIERLVHQVVQHYGSLYGLVCNAGGPPAGTFAQLTDADWEYAIQLNLMSVIRLIRASVPAMMQAGEGRIVNLASMSVKQPIAGLVLSNTIRLGLQGLVKTLSDELAPHILVNTVSPGSFETDRHRSLDIAKSQQLQISFEELRMKKLTEIPLGRYGQPQEFAKYVAFIVSPANTYMTGQMLLVDGGFARSVM